MGCGKSLAFVLASGLLGSVAAAAETVGVVDPHVATDKSVDCRTLDSIIGSLVKDGMTDEEKVITIFHWVRRVISHGRGSIADKRLRFNVHYQFHIFGTGSCIAQTTPLSVLWERAGFRTRTWATGGHHCIQVKYGGRWHLFDPHMNFYVYDRGKPPVVASVEQIKADTTLVSDAVKEGRACPGFLLCGDSVRTFATRRGWRDNGDFPEGSKKPIIVEPFGRIVLRRGESYVRTWQPGEHWFAKGHKKSGPYHSCCGKDRKDTVNWPLYEPHGAPITASWGKTTAYRHWAAGRLVYAPDLASGHYADAVASRKNVTVGNVGPTAGLVAQNGAGEIVFSVGCPYVITAGELEVAPLGPAAPGAAVSVDRGTTWVDLTLIPDQDRLRAPFKREVNGSFDGYWLKLSIPSGSGIRSLRLTSHFQLNPYSLPHLVPGKNVVTVDAKQYGSPLTVTYKWSEGPGWNTPKTVSRTFSRGGTFEIAAAGPKYPRMQSLVLSVAP